MLRNRLDKLGYKDPFGIDAMSLVLKIFNDLVQTTESCKMLKTDNDRFLQERKRLESEVNISLRIHTYTHTFESHSLSGGINQFECKSIM